MKDVVEDEKDDSVADNFESRFDEWCENAMLGVFAVRGASPECYK